MTTKTTKGAETAQEDAAAPVQIEPASEIPMTVAEYCAQRSAGDKRVELISAFFNVTNGNGLTKKTKSAFDEQFEAFCTTPA